MPRWKTLLNTVKTKMSNPLISVIVPIYMVERYLGLCIESIINQTYKNLEVILVDDGSPDRCPELCDLYASKDSRIKVIHKENGGLVSARKAGISIATGEYATYVDGDDYLELGYIDWLVRELSGSDLVIAGHSRTLFSKTSYIINNITNGMYEKEELRDLYSRIMSCDEFYKPGISTYVWNKLFRKDLLLKHQMNVPNEISIGEDAAVVYPLLLDCKKIVITDNCDYHYRQREDSMLKKTKSFAEEKQGLGTLYNYLMDFASKQDKAFRLEEQVKDFILSICFMRSGCIEVDGDLVLPFEKDFKDKNIAIYSAGTFGQQLVNRINEHRYANIVSWVDDDYWEYRRCCLNVDPIDSLYKVSFDFLLIATVNKQLAEIIKNNLVINGVDGAKILSITISKDKDYLINIFLN